MSKLHELLAVEGEVKGAYEKILPETIKTFTKKANHFQGNEKVLKTPTSQGDVKEEVVERLELTDTVEGKLQYQSDFIIRLLDISLQKEATNQKARAPIMIDGTIISDPLPATFLLGLETRLKQIRNVYETIPTLPSGTKWESDPNLGLNIYRKSNPDTAPKTQKTFRHKVLVEAQFPKEGEGGTSLPAQIEKWQETETIGTYVVESWSGMISSSDKSKFLGRIDELIRGTKKARQRANSQEVEKIKIGKVLMNFINGSN